ncbi:MAG: sigma-54-dependent Fis family transcriptional regulator [Acidobacteria bacterium]|nr:sigma-54-dependent Fis family transcriptional regulator [Acidobacteriota bacterium]
MAIARYEFLGLPVVISSPAMNDVLARIRRFAQMNATVLIEGESGTGKEVAARALHHLSMRSAKPWVDISCAVLPEHLVESELFGYEKGAFSGAEARKPGFFELAEGGTLFLDEIGDLDFKLQVKLLRVLDCGEFFRLGGTRKVKVDVRLLVATNQNLQESVAEGRFRKDLYHRLAQLRIAIPPLRERREDILPIANLFRESFGIAAGFSPQVEKALLEYNWPGNVRELKNFVLGCGATVIGDRILPRDLPPELGVGGGDAVFPVSDLARLSEVTGESGRLLETAERDLILRVMRQIDGHHRKAARRLGISVRTLSRKLKAYGLESESGEICPQTVGD